MAPNEEGCKKKKKVGLNVQAFPVQRLRWHAAFSLLFVRHTTMRVRSHKHTHTQRKRDKPPMNLSNH